MDEIEKVKILDCTLRDGGYYTNWDFAPDLVDNYFSAMNKLPIDFIEIGLRNIDQEAYFGEFYFTPLSTLGKIKKITDKPIAVLINERDLDLERIKDLLDPCVGKINLVRLAVDPKNIKSAKSKAKVIQKMGFSVAFNVMYLSQWIKDEKFLKNLNGINEFVDYLYLVDSFGAVFPNDIRKVIRRIKEITNVKLGFHSHNNLELALANTLVAIEEGVYVVDSTISGMGRGAGNLKTELLLAVISKEKFVDFNEITNVLKEFNNLKLKHKWGTNLPYMIAGAQSIHQKQIMEWIGKKFYSFNSIIKALNHDNKHIHNKKYNRLQKTKSSRGLIIGGGVTIAQHIQAIKNYIIQNKDIVLIFSSSRYVGLFNAFKNDGYICLVGNEDERLGDIQLETKLNLKYILPPSPRELGTFIPEWVDENIFEIDKYTFMENSISSHCSTAIQSAISLGFKNIQIIGFDGYIEKQKSIKEDELSKENEYIFRCASENGFKITSLTPTLYRNINKRSIYKLID